MPDALRRRLAAWYQGRREDARPAAPVPAVAAERLVEVGREADRVEALRREAHTDPVSGLPNRRHFVGLLGSVLGQGAAPERSLLLLRALNLGPLRTSSALSPGA